MKTVEVTILGGDGLPKTVVVEVTDDATPYEIMEAVKEKEHSE